MLAQIFLGKITTWNDPAIAAINSGVDAAVDRRSRCSSAPTSRAPRRTSRPTCQAPTRPTSPPPRQGLDGQGRLRASRARRACQQGIQGTDGAIGYIEWSYAGSSGLQTAKIDNGGGAVALTATTAGAAVGAAQVVGTGNDLPLKLDYATKAPGAYPIILVTYEIVCTKYADAAKGALVK